jgi:sigma-E factor negative regulatory protein RseA
MNAGAKVVRDEPFGDADCEALSCLIDGEIHPEEGKVILDRLCADPQVRSRWTELHVIGDALRSSEVAALHSKRFQHRIAAALADEPAIRAPLAFAWRRYQRALLPGMAAAAAVALLAVGIVPLWQDSGEMKSSAPAAVNVATASSTPGEVARVPQLERYLLAHRELAGGVGMPQPVQFIRTSSTAPAEMR